MEAQDLARGRGTPKSAPSARGRGTGTGKRGGRRKGPVSTVQPRRESLLNITELKQAKVLLGEVQSQEQAKQREVVNMSRELKQLKSEVESAEDEKRPSAFVSPQEVIEESPEVEEEEDNEDETVEAEPEDCPLVVGLPILWPLRPLPAGTEQAQADALFGDVSAFPPPVSCLHACTHGSGLMLGPLLNGVSQHDAIRPPARTGIHSR